MEQSLCVASRKELASRRELASPELVSQGTGLAERAEPGRAGNGKTPPRLAPGQGGRGVLGNTLLGLAGDRLTRCNMGPRNLDQTIEAVQERQSAIGRFLGKDHERLSH